MRLDKFLAQCSVGRRRDVRTYIKEGLVKVNGKIITIPAIEIDEINDNIEYNNSIVKYREKVYYMLNKPVGCVTAKKDNLNKTVFDYFDTNDAEGIFHVGRLDKNTEGLLLFTNDGEFEHSLMHPEKHVEKTYFFMALGKLDSEDIKRLEEGVYINNGEILTKPAKIEGIECGLYKDYIDKVFSDKDFFIDVTKYNQEVVLAYLTISEGRKHQVKRMLKAIGCYVVYLKRVAIGKVKLDDDLEIGSYRPLKKEEIEVLKDI